MSHKPMYRLISSLLACAMISGIAMPFAAYADDQIVPESTLVSEATTSDAAQTPEDLVQQTQSQATEESEPEPQPEIVEETQPEQQMPEESAQEEKAQDPVNLIAQKEAVSNVEIKRPKAATDGNKTGANDKNQCTEILAGAEDGSSNNGYEKWQDVYVQYDLGSVQTIAQVNIWRNTYDNAVSAFKNVKVEVSETADFAKSTVLFDTQDVRETAQAKPNKEDSAEGAAGIVLGEKGAVQTIVPETPAKGQYIRVWQKGHYITNTSSSWNGMSNGVLFNEIEVWDKVVTPPAPNPGPAPDGGNKPGFVDANILLGKLPKTNSTTNVTGGGNSTASGVVIENKNYATDGEIGDSVCDNGTNQNTKIVAGDETGKQPDNGYSGWNPVYLEYDFEQVRDVKKINIYRNTYDHAKSTFKDVKVELSNDPEFKTSTVVFGGDKGQDVQENTRGEAQVIELKDPVQARYMRIWQKGHYIVNDNHNWEGMSNGIMFNEIEVIASIPESEIPPTPPASEKRNIASGKLPYVWGLTPTNIEAITDGKADTNYAVHNSLGNRWLQFEYKNRYTFKEIKFKLEEGTYKSVKVSVSNDPSSEGTVVFQENNWKQGPEMKVIDLGKAGKKGKYVRFTVNKADNEPTKYSEIEIWASGSSFDESKPEYVAPQSKYNKLVWSDEFNGTTLDESKWQVIEGMANHGAIYNRGAVSVKDGCLVLNTKNYNTTEELKKAVGLDQYQNEVLGRHVTWSSGRVESKNKFSFEFGRVAVRAKPNDSKGIWPAIWMLCQDETGHDEIDILEYLGQESWRAYTTNHFGILDHNKESHGDAKVNYEAWCQDFHVFEVEWDPEIIKFFIDGELVHSTTKGKEDRDAMHTRPMFVILETQVGAGWVGDVDYNKQETKQDSNFLIDWVHVYQQENQPVTRFDDLGNIYGKPVQDPYFVSPVKATEGLQVIRHAEGTNVPAWQDKDNFYYGGQPRVETDRVAPGADVKGEQALVYHVDGVKDVHLTTYYQTLSDAKNWSGQAGTNRGVCVRDRLKNGANIDFKIMTSPDGSTWTPFNGIKIVNNFPECYPSYARITFDAYNLPKGTNFVKVIFPEYSGVQYTLNSGKVNNIQNTDIQLAKVTFLQDTTAAPYINYDELNKQIAAADNKAGEKDKYTPASWNALQTALDHAKGLLNQAKNQKDVDDAAKALKDTLNGLTVKADKAALAAAIDAASKKQQKDYTETSWQEFAKAFESAKSVNADQNASQEQVNKALNELNQAVKALVAKPAEPEKPQPTEKPAEPEKPQPTEKPTEPEKPQPTQKPAEPVQTPAPKSPATGDYAGVLLWGSVAAVSGGALIAIKKKYSQN